MLESILGAFAGPLIGGLLGGEEQQQSQSTKQTLDPRMEGAIYGDGGLLSGARDWYAANKIGMNPQMLAGMNSQYAQHQASQPGFDQMQNLGMGLMGQGATGNPFSSGYSGGANFGSSGMAPRPQQYQPAQPGGSTFAMPPPPPPPAPIQQAAPAIDQAYLNWMNRPMGSDENGRR